MKWLVLALGSVLWACGGDLDPPWQLDHDRIVAVRVTPPAIVAGERAEIDGLVAIKGAPTMQGPPEAVMVVKPESLASAVTTEDGKWFVTAPDDIKLEAARGELGIAAGEPVPLELGVSYSGGTRFGLKSVRLGVSAQNPELGVPMIDGRPAPAAGSEIVVGSLVDVPLSIEEPDEFEVEWLTSCGTLHDHDLHEGYLRVEADDPTAGEFAVVVRDDVGGVAWQVWPIRAR